MTDRIPLMTTTCLCGNRLVYRTLLSEQSGMDRLRLFHGDDGMIASMLIAFDRVTDEVVAHTLIARAVATMERSRRVRPSCFEMWKAARDIYV